MNLSTVSVSPRPSRVALALAGALLVASILAIVLQESGVCGSCDTRQGPWRLIAPAGVVGYSALIALAFLSPQHLFPLGAAIAAAVHTVLVAAMAMLGRFCPICIVAATLAIALLIVTLVRSRSRMKLIAFVYVPAVLLASGPTAWALARG